MLSASNEAASAIPTRTPTIKHLYLFDDLTHHIRRFTDDDEKFGRVSQSVGHATSELLDCLDYGYQDVNLINWDHACSQLLWSIEDRNSAFDLVVAQGANGEYALDSLLTEYKARHGRDLALHRANVRVAHFLNDPDDPFYSDFTIGVSSGPPLEEQCAAAMDLTSGLDRIDEPLRVAVFDDCIQTGEGTKAVVEHLLAAAGNRAISISTIGFIACESTQNHFRDLGFTPIQGVLLRGLTYPAAWDWDIYFLKDLFLDNAVRFTNGLEVSYAEHGDWLEHIFGESAERARGIILGLRAALVEDGIYQKLLEL